MSHWHELRAGDTISNDQLFRLFKCAQRGGMRRSIKTNSLVIVSNHVESLYDDRWISDILHYTGMGRNGDQSKTFLQNRSLYESKSNGIDVFFLRFIREWSIPIEEKWNWQEKCIRKNNLMMKE